MWSVVCYVGVVGGPEDGRKFTSAADAKAYCEHLSKHYKSYDIYKDDKLVGVGDRYGYRSTKRYVKKGLIGSIGYAQMMSEKR